MTDKSAVPPELEEKLAELEILRQALDEAKKKADAHYDQWLRARAEFDNFRKRAEREKAEARLMGKQDVLMPLLQLVDVFEQALAQTETATNVAQVRIGLEFLHKNFASFLKTEGLSPIEIVGKPLDPHLAEAVEQVDVPEAQNGVVLSEIQRGYLFQGRVLRPSRVRVGFARAGAGGQAQSTND